MKILLKVSLSGVNFSYHAGEEVDVDEAVAKQWIEAGYAETMTATPATKAAVTNKIKAEDKDLG